MKVYLATDHAGYALKEVVKAFLLGKEYMVEDYGALSFDPHDDYPDFIAKAAQAISDFPEDKAIIFGGNGQGEAIAANKFKNVRAAVFYGTKLPVGGADVKGRMSEDPYEMIKLVREHNDANMLSLGARFLTDEEALEAVELFLTTSFSDEERHVRRIKKINEIEKENQRA